VHVLGFTALEQRERAGGVEGDAIEGLGDAVVQLTGKTLALVVHGNLGGLDEIGVQRVCGPPPGDLSYRGMRSNTHDWIAPGIQGGAAHVSNLAAYAAPSLRPACAR
jgi:hypothetical protein